MSGKIRGAFNDEQFDAFCQELLALPAKERTLKGIADFFEKRTGIKASHEAADTFKHGALARWIEQARAGRKLGEAIKEATGAGVDNLEAIEQIAVIELQDHVQNTEKIDVEWLSKQLLKLRTSISMREEARRKQTDLERKVLDSETSRANSERRTELLEERLKLLQLDAAKAAIQHAQELRAIASDKSLDAAEKLERARLRLFGDAPAAVPSLTEVDSRKKGGAA